MFAKFFSRPAPKPLPQPTPQLALGALLVRVAFADAQYRAAEIGQIDRILARSFDLGPIEAAKMRATCESLEREAPGTQEFARILREEVDYADRKTMGDALWQVALADGHRHDNEEIQLLAISVALGLTELDIKSAREEALRAL